MSTQDEIQLTILDALPVEAQNAVLRAAVAQDTRVGKIAVRLAWLERLRREPLSSLIKEALLEVSFEEVCQRVLVRRNPPVSLSEAADAVLTDRLAPFLDYESTLPSQARTEYRGSLVAALAGLPSQPPDTVLAQADDFVQRTIARLKRAT
jgi:hypothetical protein